MTINALGKCREPSRSVSTAHVDEARAGLLDQEAAAT